MLFDLTRRKSSVAFQARCKTFFTIVLVSILFYRANRYFEDKSTFVLAFIDAMDYTKNVISYYDVFEGNRLLENYLSMTHVFFGIFYRTCELRRNKNREAFLRVT